MTSSSDTQAQALSRAAFEAASRGEPDAAAALYRQALALQPNSWEIHFHLGNLFRDTQKYAEALDCFRRSFELNPSRYDTKLNIGATCFDLGRIADAVTVLIEATTLAPGETIAYLNLGKILRTTGRPAEAREWLEAGLRATRPSTDIQVELGLVFADTSLSVEAADIFTRVLTIAPDHILARLNLALALLKLGRTDDAVGHIDTLEQLSPHNPQVQRLKLLAGKQRGDTALIAIAARNLLTMTPEEPSAISELLAVSTEDSERADLRNRLHIACRQTPADIAGWKALAHARFNDSGYESAIEVLEEGTACTDDASLRLYCALTLPKVALSIAQIDAARANMDRHLDILIHGKYRATNLLKSVNKTAFHLAYHGMDDKNLQEKIAATHLAVSPDLAWRAPHCDRKGRSRSKMRIGFISASLSWHAVGTLIAALIKQIDRRKFEVVVIRPVAANDDEGRAIDASADGILVLPPNLAAAREAVAGLELDLLFYPDIGMDPFTYYLAFSRLAPVQAAWPGHPLTTGLPEIDVFFSSAMTEPPNADEHYSERLIRLSKLPTYTTGRQPRFDRNYLEEFALSAHDRLYVCPMTIYKFHPEFDLLLKRILEGDRQGKLVLIGDNGTWHRLLRQRMTLAIPDLAARLIVLPFLAKNQFFGLLNRADVILDTIHFGGGNTCLDAFAVGAPVVTKAGRFLRSRTTAGKYRQMGVSGLTVDSDQAYVDLAVRLASDRSAREKFSPAIRENYSKLILVKSVLTEFEEHFAALIGTSA